MKILLAEDDKLLGNGICADLAQGGFTVDWAKDGRAAELALAGVAYAAVLSDLGLPKISGLDVLRQIRGAKNAEPIDTARITLDFRVAAPILG